MRKVEKHGNGGGKAGEKILKNNNKNNAEAKNTQKKNQNAIKSKTRKKK